MASTVFISYPSSDAQFANQLAARLRRAGLEPWLDTEQMWGGMPIDRGLQEGIEKSGCGIFLISPDWVQRDFTTKEIRLFAKRDSTGVQVPRIGVLRTPRPEIEKDIPAELVRFSDIDWVDGVSDADASFWRVYSAIVKQSPGPRETWAQNGRAVSGEQSDDAPLAAPTAVVPRLTAARLALLCNRDREWQSVETYYVKPKHHLVVISGPRGEGHQYFLARIEAYLERQPPASFLSLDWRMRPSSANEFRERIARSLGESVDTRDVPRELYRRMQVRNLVMLLPSIDDDFDDPHLLDCYNTWLPDLLGDVRPAMKLKCIQPVAWSRPGALARLLRRLTGPDWFLTVEEKEASRLLETIEKTRSGLETHDVAPVKIGLGPISEDDLHAFCERCELADDDRRGVLACTRGLSIPEDVLKAIDRYFVGRVRNGRVPMTRLEAL